MPSTTPLFSLSARLTLHFPKEKEKKVEREEKGLVLHEKVEGERARRPFFSP